MSETRKWSEPPSIARLSRTPVGPDLARRVARRLIQDRGRKGIWFRHRDYCGHGLVALDGKITLMSICDGAPSYSQALLSWVLESDFVSWLARQNDHSLAGAEPCEKELYTQDSFELNNQRLTTERLRKYLDGPTTC